MGARRRGPPPKSRSEPPPPRVPGPITEREVLEWGQRIEDEARRCREAPDRSLPPLQLRILEESFHFLLDRKFRDEFSETLYGPEQLAAKDFFVSDPERGQKLLRRWGVIEIMPPRWDPARGRYRMLAPFHIPIVHWGSKPGEEDPVEPSINIRLLLRRQRTSYHPVYMLACKRCGWLQGALGSAETFWSKVPPPRQQLLHLVESRRHPSGVPRDKNGAPYCPIYKRHRRSQRLGKLAESFAEEVWGGGVAHPRVQSVEPGRRSPVSGPMADLLEGVSGFRTPWPSTSAALHRQRRPWKLLALALAQIQCQVCRRDGGIRYLLRYLTYIDADLSRTTWKGLADSLAEELQMIRGQVVADSVRSKILWLPEDMPDPIPHQIAGRIAQACDRIRLKRRAPRPKARDLAVWIGNAARKGAEYWREHVEEELDLPRGHDDLYSLVSGLREEILVQMGDKDPGQVAGSILGILESDRYAPILPPISDYHRRRIFPQVLARRRHKVFQRS